jgi:hypothetical protein
VTGVASRSPSGTTFKNLAPATQSEPAKPQPLAATPKPFPRTVALLSTLLAIAVLGLVLDRLRAPAYVLVNGEASPTTHAGPGPGPSEPPPVDAKIEAPADPAPFSTLKPEQPQAEIKPTHKKPKGGDALTAAFAGQRAKITSCFDQHAEAVVGLPQLSIRFHVGADGKVQQAELQPPELGTTPLGVCILEVARATEFGKLDKAVTFRIPVTVRRE